MSQMMSAGPGQAGPPPAAVGQAQSGGYPSQNDPAMQLLSKAADMIAQFVTVEPDPQKKSDGAKLLAACHQIIGANEKQHDAAIGMSPALKMVQRQSAASASGPPPGGGGLPPGA